MAQTTLARIKLREYGCFTVLFSLLMITVGCQPDHQQSTDSPVPKSDSLSNTGGSGTIAFRDVAESVGIEFRHFNGATADMFLPEITGSGVALFDYDNDGDLDTYLVQSDRINQRTPLRFPDTNVSSTPKLFENRLIPDGALTFEDVTEKAGLAIRSYGMGVGTGDLDNDGDIDLYLTDLGPDRVFLNNGDGTFSGKSQAQNDAVEGWSTSVDLLDFDLDGNLDIFVARYADLDREVARMCNAPTGEREYCNPDIYIALTDVLLKGDGQGRLRAVDGWEKHGPAPSTGLGVVAADFNGDNLPDVYVANDKRENQLWINLGDGHFEDQALLNGAALNGDGKAEASMGVTAGDLDSDGDMDLFITHLQGESNTLYLNQGGALFFDGTLGKKLAGSSIPSTGFGTRWFDLDNDGDLDLFAANGAVQLEPSQISTEDFPYVQHNQLFENTGRQFADVSESSGLRAMPREISRGAAFGDVDNDGDVDILVSNNHGPARLLLNESVMQGGWLSVLLRDDTGNRYGIGALVGLELSDDRTQWHRVTTGDSYLSASDIRTHIGLGAHDESALSVIVAWPDGSRERWSDITPNQVITLVRGSGEKA